jgi:hypothetical protein
MTDIIIADASHRLERSFEVYLLIGITFDLIMMITPVDFWTMTDDEVTYTDNKFL